MAWCHKHGEYEPITVAGCPKCNYDDVIMEYPPKVNFLEYQRIMQAHSEIYDELEIAKAELNDIIEKADKLAITLHMICVENENIGDVEAMDIIDAYYSVRGEP